MRKIINPFSAMTVVRQELGWYFAYKIKTNFPFKR